MKIVKDSFGNTRIYPFVDADAAEEAYYMHGYIDVLTAPIGDIRLNMAFNAPAEATRWQTLCEAMEKAFEIQREARAGETNNTRAKRNHAHD